MRLQFEANLPFEPALRASSPNLPSLERTGVLVKGPHGRIFTAKLAPDKVFFFFDGHVELDMFAPSMVIANEVVKSGAATLYGDGGTWKSYGPGYRGAWTDWFMAHRKSLVATHLVAASPVIRMGVQVVNLFAGSPITALSKSDELYRVLATDVPRLRETAASWPAEFATHVKGASLSRTYA